MPVQKLPDPQTVEICVFTLDSMVNRHREVKEENENLKTELKITKQANEILEAKNTKLEQENTELKSKVTREETIMQLADDDLRTSKKVLQCVCAVAGAILGGGLVLAFPPAGAAMALGGTGSAIVGVSTAGVALAGGATGGCLVAPVIHERTHKALIQQVQNFKAKEETSKKAE